MLYSFMTGKVYKSTQELLKKKKKNENITTQFSSKYL